MRIWRFLTITLLIFFSAVARMSASTEDTVQFSVTGNVNSRPEQMQLEIAADFSENSTISQEQTMLYTLTYGSTSSRDTVVTITVSYTALAPDGSGEQLIDYVPGSAVSANGSIGIINHLQRTITWQNILIPANSSQLKLQFQLKSNSRFQDANTEVPLVVSAAITEPFIIPSRTFPYKYRYNLALVPPTPTIVPTLPPQSLVTKTVKPTTTVKDMVITQLNSRAITIEVLANKNSNLRIKYGSAPKQLNRTINSISKTGNHQFKITNLKPSTTYYFQLQYLRPDGIYAIFDTHVFRTPSQTEELELNTLYSISARNAQGIVFDGQLFALKYAPPVILLPRSSKLSFDLRYDSKIPLDLAQILLYRPDLKIPTIAARSSSSQSSAPSTAVTDLDAIYKNLDIPGLIGDFTLKTRLQTKLGNISESAIAEIKVIKPIMVRRQHTGAPIKEARITVYKYNPDSNDFYPYPDPKKPPLVLYSEDDGGVPFVPQEGRFRFQVDRVPFHSKIVDMHIKLSPTMVLPDIELKSSMVSWLEPIAHIISELSTDSEHSSFQEWLNEWSEAIIGKALFPAETQSLSTTDSF